MVAGSQETNRAALVGKRTSDILLMEVSSQLHDYDRGWYISIEVVLRHYPKCGKFGWSTLRDQRPVVIKFDREDL